jgi:quercetin 2,3-dioxygenase
MGNIDLRPANSRFHTKISWLESWHSFSFGEHWDPNNTNHGLLLVSNDDIVSPGSGFPTHPHRDMEIVTWVLEGALGHRDSEGNDGVITRDVAQRMSAGTGIRHSEMNASNHEPVHLLQMWVPPDTNGLPPGYEQRDVAADIKEDELFPLASGRVDDAAIHINQKDATLWILRQSPRSTVTLPDAPWLHVFVARGEVKCADNVVLHTGDAARCTDAGVLTSQARDDGAELVIWETWSEVRR